MNHARYVGKRSDLLGRSALIRRGMIEGEVLAQFDFPPGTEFSRKGSPLGVLEPIAHLTSRDMVPKFPDEHPECFSWHSFSREEFRLTEDMPNEVTEL